MNKKKGGLKKLQIKIETTKKQIDRVQKDGADVELAVSLLNEAEMLSKKGDEAELTKILSNIGLIIKQAKAKKKYEMMIFNSLPMIEKARRAGANVDASEALLAKAKELLEKGEFGDAHEQIKLARREADNAKHFMTAKAHIQRVAPLVEAAKKKGVKTHEATNAILEAWKELNKGNYDVVADLAKNVTTYLNIAEEQKSYEVSIKDMEARIAAVAESGMDTAAMADLLKKAKLSLETEDFGDVKTCVNKIRREIEKIILQREAGLTLRTIQQFMREAKRAGIKSAELEDLLEKASVAIKSGDFSQVRSLEMSAKQAVKNLRLLDTLSAGDIGVMDKEREEGLVALIREELEESKAVVERARAGGMDISEIEELIRSTEAALNAGKLTESFDAVKRVSKLIHDGKSGFQTVEAKKKLEEMYAAFEEAKAIGIEVSEAEALASQAKTMDGEGNSGGAAEIIKKATSALSEAIKNGNAGKHPRLKAGIRFDGFEAQKWGRASVELSNTGNSIAKNIDVTFFGDMEVRGWKVIPRLMPGQKASEDIALKPFKPGKVPLDMTVSYEKSFDDTKFQLNDMKEVDVAEPGSFLVEDVFMIHNNGLLVTKQTRRIKEEVDGDIFSAMLMAITQFAKDSFNIEEKVALNRLEFGDNQVLIERGGAFILAITMLGEESVYMPFYISEVIEEIEEKYGGVLERWDGDMNQLEGVDLIVRKLLLIKNTETGIPDFGESALHPAVNAIRNGTAIPDLEKNIKELLTTFEEELISGEMAEADELMDKIREAAETGLRRTDADEGEKKKEEMLRESIGREVQVIRRHMDNVKASGANISAEEGMLSDSLASLERGEYESARGMLTEIEKFLREKEKLIVAQTVSKRMDELKATLAVASKMGVDISDLEGMAQDAKKLLASDQGGEVNIRLDEILGMLSQKTRGFMANKYPKLQVEVKGTGAHESGNWSRMEVVVHNKGNTPARNIDLNFAGDLEVKAPGPVEQIEPNGSRNLELSVRPAKNGKIPLEVSATYQRYFDDTKYQLNDMKGIDVDAPGSYIVEDAFLIHNNGLLIARETRRIKEEVDSDLFSAMLKALTDFIGQTLNVSKKGGLDRMEFGGKKLLIEKGKFVFLAITISGDESVFVPFFMTELIGEIESKYGTILDNWNGEMKPLEGIEDMLQKIIFVKQTGKENIPVFKSSVLAPVLEMAAEGGGDMSHIREIELKLARMTETVEADGIEAAQKYLVEMEDIVCRLTALPSAGSGGSASIDADALKKRMYDIMIRSGHVDKDSALMDARLNNYLEVVGKISDAVFNLRERNGIPADQTLARVAAKHPDYERWNEVMGNMRKLLLEQTNAMDVQILRPEDVWGGLKPTVKIDEEHIRGAYKHIALKIISVLKYMPPDKLQANIRKGTFTIGVEGQQVYITDKMISISFSLPPGAFEAPLDSGVIYIDTNITEEVRSDASQNALIDKINEMRLEIGAEEGAKIEVQVIASDALVEALEKARDAIIAKCGAYDVIFPFDDPLGSGEYHVGELKLEGEPVRIGIVLVEFDG